MLRSRSTRGDPSRRPCVRGECGGLSGPDQVGRHARAGRRSASKAPAAMAPVSHGRCAAQGIGCFRHQLLLPRPYLVLTKPLRLDIQSQRGASVKIGWKYLDD